MVLRSLQFRAAWPEGCNAGDIPWSREHNIKVLGLCVQLLGGSVTILVT